MSQPFPVLQHRYRTFFASVEEATLQDLLEHIEMVNSELQGGECEDENTPEYQAVMSYLKDNPSIDQLWQLEEDIRGVEALLEEHGDRRLK